MGRLASLRFVDVSIKGTMEVYQGFGIRHQHVCPGIDGVGVVITGQIISGKLLDLIRDD